MLNYRLFLSLFVLFLVVPAAVSAQEQTFSSAAVEYTFELPNAKWKMTVKPSETTPNVEYVYGDRNDGHLEVRKLTLSNNAVISDLIRDEEQKQQFRQGFVSGKEEAFGGFLNGNVFNYEYVRSGRAMSVRCYFLKVDNSSVYLLRFTGFKDSLRSILNQTDSIARTFNIKKK